MPTVEWIILAGAFLSCSAIAILQGARRRLRSVLYAGVAFAVMIVLAAAGVDYSGEDCVEGNECWQGVLTFFGFLVGLAGLAAVILIGLAAFAVTRAFERMRD